MVTHDNIHIPGESFPHWIWFVIEFFIVLAIAAGISSQITPIFEEFVVWQNWECTQKSHITDCSLSEEASPDEVMLNWIFWSIIAVIFFVWYILIRGIILKKSILQNRS